MFQSPELWILSEESSMPHVLIQTQLSNVLCGELVPGSLHGGYVNCEGVSKLKVQGNMVLLKTGIKGKSITGCQNHPSPDNNNQPCKTVNEVKAGEAKKLKVEGESVILDSLSGSTDGQPVGSLKANAGQTKLTAI